jgi:hypothetical protein
MLRFTQHDIYGVTAIAIQSFFRLSENQKPALETILSFFIP